MGRGSRDGVVGAVERCWIDFDVGCGVGIRRWMGGLGSVGLGGGGWLVERSCTSGLSVCEVYVVSGFSSGGSLDRSMVRWGISLVFWDAQVLIVRS